MQRQQGINLSPENSGFSDSGYSDSHGNGGMCGAIFPITWVILIVGAANHTFGYVPSIQKDVHSGHSEFIFLLARVIFLGPGNISFLL